MNNIYQNIEEICNQYRIFDYKINDDYTIDVNGNVYLCGLGLTQIPLNFNEINGSFYVSNNKLNSLEGSPKKCDNFFCNLNPLYSFNYFPYILRGNCILPDNLNYLLSLFDNRVDLIDLFNDFNITKEPSKGKVLPRLKLAHLNKFLTELNLNEYSKTNVLSIFFEIK